MDAKPFTKTPPGICVGLPFCGRPVAPEWAVSLAIQAYPLGSSVTIKSLRGMQVAEARNIIAEAALAERAKYLWFIDDDTAPPAFAIKKLVYALEKNPDAAICGGIYFTRDVIPEPCVFKEPGQGCFWNWHIDEVFECGGIGTGCMLIRTEIFSKLEKPWFKTIDECPIEKDPNGPWTVQETDDLYFCEKVRAAGYKILAHGGVLPVHWDAANGIPYTMPVDCYPAREHAKQNSKKDAAV
jgi:hypothetical protein